jgi:glycosyltransferase involved in cell wall biosynthesis
MARRYRHLHHVFIHAAQVIVPNVFVRDVHARLGFPAERSVIVPFGIDGSAADFQAVQAARQAAAQRAANQLHIGFVGSVAWQKGVDVLISAVNQLPDEGVTLSIYGGLSAFPGYVALLRKLARHPGIRFCGAVSREALWPALGELDVFVFPSVWYEGSPFVIREAFAAGVPVVASRIGALPEMVRHGTDGLLFPPGDVGALRDILHSLMDDRPQLQRMRSNIPPAVTFEQHVEHIAAVYHEAGLRPSS